jgi:hypothetical protein
MGVMRSFAIGGVAIVVGCARGGDRAADTTAMDTTGMAAPAPAGAGIALSELAGRWEMRAVPESGSDTSATTYVLTANENVGGWTIQFPNRAPIPVSVSTSGDSIVMDAGPFESARRKGVQVTTNTVLRHEGGRLVGMTVAHYPTTGADSVLRLRTEGTKAP